MREVTSVLREHCPEVASPAFLEEFHKQFPCPG
jgi:hypothetical protein